MTKSAEMQQINQQKLLFYKHAKGINIRKYVYRFYITRGNAVFRKNVLKSFFYKSYLLILAFFLLMADNI